MLSEDASLLDMPLSVVSGVIAKKCEMFKNSLRVAGQVKLSSGITEDLGAMCVTVNYMQSSKPPLSLMSAQKVHRELHCMGSQGQGYPYSAYVNFSLLYLYLHIHKCLQRSRNVLQIL